MSGCSRLFGRLAWVVLFVSTVSSSAWAAAADPSQWESYLDYAYVYSSADPAALDQRLAEYSKEAGISLEEYLLETFETMRLEGGVLDEISLRREAIGNLLLYLASREKDFLDRSVEVIDSFSGKLGRHEDLYWLHYIKAHKALERENWRTSSATTSTSGSKSWFRSRAPTTRSRRYRSHSRRTPASSPRCPTCSRTSRG